MAFSNAEKFTSLGMAFPLAKEVGTAIEDAPGAALAAVVTRTDSTAGTPSTTAVGAIPAAVAATTDTTAASLASTNAALAALRNDLSTLTVWVNSIVTGLKA